MWILPVILIALAGVVIFLWKRPEEDEAPPTPPPDGLPPTPTTACGYVSGTDGMLALEDVQKAQEDEAAGKISTALLVSIVRHYEEYVRCDITLPGDIPVPPPVPPGPEPPPPDDPSGCNIPKSLIRSGSGPNPWKCEQYAKLLELQLMQKNVRREATAAGIFAGQGSMADMPSWNENQLMMTIIGSANPGESSQEAQWVRMLGWINSPLGFFPYETVYRKWLAMDTMFGMMLYALERLLLFNYAKAGGPLEF